MSKPSCFYCNPSAATVGDICGVCLAKRNRGRCPHRDCEAYYLPPVRDPEPGLLCEFCDRPLT